MVTNKKNNYTSTMETARKPTAILFLNKKDITNSVQQYLSSVTYTNHEEEATDEISLVLDNTSGIWLEEWYPTEGDTLQLYIGYQDKQVDSGLFEIDDITLSGMPDQITVKAIAAGTSKALRTRNNKAFEEQTLRQIAKYFCKKHGFTLIDGSHMLAQIWLDRKTQENKTDLAFLSDLAKEYGFMFTVKGSKMVFISYHDLEETPSVCEIDKTQVSSYELNEKTYDTYASGSIRHRNPRKGLIEYSAENVLETNRTDKKIFTGHVSSKGQAEAKVKGGLWNKNKYRQSGTIVLPGEPLLIAGNNFDFTGMGMGSGKYHIPTSTHSIDSSGGYTTALEIRKTGTIPRPKRVPRVTQPKPTTTETAFDSLGEQNEE
jgi:phage protein D